MSDEGSLDQTSDADLLSQGLGLTPSDAVNRVLELARRHLDMDLAFLAQFDDDKQVYRGLSGDAASFGWSLDEGLALDNTYCALMTADRIPNAIPDTATHPLLRDLPVTSQARIGSYVGVPITLSDGTLYGTLCAVDHAHRAVDARDTKFLALLAEILAADLERQRELEVSRARIWGLITSEDLQIALQPIVALTSGKIVGFEALSRFDHGRPDEVFREAHRVGAGIDLERLALRKAVELLPSLGEDRFLALNLSAETAAWLDDAARGDASMRFDQLVLEITEHEAVQDYAQLRSTLAHMRGRGARLAVDDAGAGYASLQHIVELAPDIIKIDRTLIDGLADDRVRHSVVTAFVTLAHSIGAQVVAEGVERVDDLRSAQSLGLELAQGYLLARPSTDHNDLAAWLTGPYSLPL